MGWGIEAAHLSTYGYPHQHTHAASIPAESNSRQPRQRIKYPPDVNEVTMNGTQILMPAPGHWDRATPADWADVLATFSLFSEISRRRLRKLVRRATFAEYMPGDTVVQKGTTGNSLYVILSGSATVLGKLASRPLRTGDYFGELSLLEGTPRSATVVAATELHVMRLPRKAFVSIAEYPAASQELLRTLGAQIRRLEAQPAHA